MLLNKPYPYLGGSFVLSAQSGAVQYRQRLFFCIFSVNTVENHTLIHSIAISVSV